MAKGCGCKRLDAVQLANSQGARVGYVAKPGRNGVYEMASSPGCFQPYEGDYRTQSVFVVGLGTEQETIFLRANRTEAIEYSKENRLELHHLPAHNLCHQAMEEFFAGV